MNDRDEQLSAMLRRVLPPVHVEDPPRDLWPDAARRWERPARGVPLWWLDLGLAAFVASVCVLFPEWIWVLTYHL